MSEPGGVGLTIANAIAAQCARAPDAVAIAAPGRAPLSYGALDDLLRAAVRALAAMGLGRGDRVALAVSQGPEMATAVLAVATAAACAPLNPALRAEECARHLARLRPAALVAQAGAGAPARAAAARLGIPVVDLAPRPGAPVGSFDLAGVVRPAVVHAPAGADDVAVILPTSGTTADPKLVPLTQGALCTSARAVADSLALGPSERCLNVMPLSHVHGLVGALLASLVSGGRIVCGGDFHAPGFPAALEAEEATWYTAVPTMHQAILAVVRRGGAPVRHRLRVIRSCSAPLPPAALEELEATFGVPVVEAYGMTEAAHQVASNPLPPRRRKPGSVGLATGSEIRLVDAAGETTAPGETGEIAIRGPAIMSGYLDDPGATRAAFAGGWLRTGDLGRVDADGYLFIAGRLKELINRAGEKIAPREVEEALLAHPAVAGALVFPAPHPQLGEEVAALVVLRAGDGATARELRAFTAARLADFKVPRRMLFAPALPLGPTGKPDRAAAAALLPRGQATEGEPRAGGDGAGPPDSSAAPSGILECAVAAIWCSILGLETAGVDDDFFAQGGDSLLAFRVLARVRAGLGADVPLHVFFETPTIAMLAREVAADTSRRAPPAVGEAGGPLAKPDDGVVLS